MAIDGAKAITEELIYEQYHKGHRLIIPNFYPPDWWECDIFSIMNNNMSYEFEVKVSRGDYFKDFKKEVEVIPDLFSSGKSREVVRAVKKKHEILENPPPGIKFVPNFFYFVVPQNLIKVKEVPKYAGLIYWHGSRMFSILKRAKKITKAPVSPAVIRKLAVSINARFLHSNYKDGLFKVDKQEQKFAKEYDEGTDNIPTLS